MNTRVDPARQAVGQTFGYFGAHVALGLMSAVLGPTLPALAVQVGSAPDALGVLFAARSLGYLLASLVIGPVYDRRMAHPVLIVALLSIAASLAAVPLMPTRAALIGVLLVMGVAQGVLDVGNNMMLMRVHGQSVAPYMSALHCFYGVGALLAPLCVSAAPSLAWGYWSLALAMLPVAVHFALTRSPRPVASRPTDLEARPTTSSRLLWLLVAFFLLGQGAEAGFAGWIYTVALGTGFSEQAAARLLSSFWAAFTLGRMLSIAAAAYVRPKIILTVDLLGALLSVTWLLLLEGPSATWIGTLALGLSLASLFPATMSLAGERLRLRGAVTSKLFVGASLGSMLVPWGLGYTLTLGPRGPLWIILVDLLLAGAVLMMISRYRETARDSHLPPAT
jgi:FHS family Na+ dependent glucose MFS transporter 1